MRYTAPRGYGPLLSEVMTILGTEPDTEQIAVDAARGFRYAAADGTYDKMLALLTHRRE